MIILGLDPGLGCTGWGVIRAEGNRLSHIANGQVRTDARAALPQRLDPAGFSSALAADAAKQKERPKASAMAQ